jgi:hypothetical protein
MAADPVSEFEAYRDELLELLGDSDPLDVLAHTPSRLEGVRLSCQDDVEP